MSSKKIYTTVGIGEPLMATLRGYALGQKRSLGFIVEEALKSYFSKLLVEEGKEESRVDKTKTLHG